MVAEKKTTDAETDGFTTKEMLVRLENQISEVKSGLESQISEVKSGLESQLSDMRRENAAAHEGITTRIDKLDARAERLADDVNYLKGGKDKSEQHMNMWWKFGGPIIGAIVGYLVRLFTSS